MSKILILDANNTMYRAYHSYARLQNHGKPVSIIYGMPILVNGLINQFKPDMIYLCWDGSRSSHRLKLCPDYKKGRRTKTEQEKKAFYKQRDKVMEVFHSLGLKQLYTRNMEADDYIYMLVRKFKKDKNNKITIVSTDKDFHQLLCDNVKIYNTAAKQLIHSENVKLKFGYTAKNSVDYLILTGDDSDNIKGYPGVGPAKAKGLIEKFSSIKEFLNSEENFSNIDKVKLRELYKVNKKLIDLKYFYKKFIRGKIGFRYYLNDSKPKLDTGKLFEICNQYSIKTFKDKNFLKNYK